METVMASLIPILVFEENIYLKSTQITTINVPLVKY